MPSCRSPAAALLLLCSMAAAAIPLSRAQSTAADFLAAHNAARAAVDVGPVAWDAGAAARAEDRAAKGSSAGCWIGPPEGDDDEDEYGENAAAVPGDWSAARVVEEWVGEGEFYTYGSDTCACEGCCGNYTQVVWRASVGLGCARARCGGGGDFVICNYSPAGNIVGEQPY